MIVGIDLGGTSCKIGFYDDGRILDYRKIAIDRRSGYKDIIKKIADEIISTNYKIDYVGIGTPGSIDRRFGIIKYSPNFPNWENVNIVKDLRDLIGCDVYIENDANIFALGERYFGLAKGLSDFIGITLGTGIGGGIFVNNKLLLGVNGFGGEVGHMKLSKDGPLCGCGKRGCFEAWCSSENIKKRYNKLFGTDLETKDILKMSDPKSREFLNETFDLMSMAIANLVNIFNPSLIVLGGGLTKSSSLFLDNLIANTTNYVLPSFVETYDIKISQLGENSAVLGAISLVIYKNKLQEA